jgi:tetratricopeptide (TPR) repeat protein
MVDRLSPLCVDAIFHTCLLWGNSNVPPTPEANREFAKNFEIGDIYFKAKNYRGAESRFREALEYRPDDPEVTYKLAVSVAKLGRRDEARELYEDYLKFSPRGPDADRVRNALIKVEKSESSSKRDTK